MTPPVVTTLWREIPKSAEDPEPLFIDGHFIPPGTEAGVNIYTIHHDERYFPDPYNFNPERWLGDESILDEDGKEARKIMYDAFTPFSSGPRGCAGKAMAYLEASLTIVKTFWYLDFERPTNNRKVDQVGEGVEGKTDGRGRKLEFQVKDHFSSVHNGPNLVFKLRGDEWKSLCVDGSVD